MRYIGSKINLLNEIYNQVEGYGKKYKSFCDIFSGTTVVANHFKKKYQIISNDLLYFSYVIQRATIQNNIDLTFEKLSKKIGKDPFNFFSEYDITKHVFSSAPFVMENFSPYRGRHRKYLSEINAKRIDFVRQTINQWKKDNLIDDNEFYYLIACLIEAIPYVSNIAGTYGAFLKHWDRRSHYDLNIKRYDSVFNNKKDNISYNKDANELIKEITGDILYIDPPYNSRQYGSNYHLLETVARYDSPVLKGMTGIRDDARIISDYCMKTNVHRVFEDLIRDARFKLIIVSYSTEGILSENEIEFILKKYGKKETFTLTKIPYRRYSRVSKDSEDKLFEYLFRIEK